MLLLIIIIIIISVAIWPTLTRSRSRTLLLTFSAKSEVLEIMVCRCWASLITNCRLGLKNTELWYCWDFTLSYQGCISQSFEVSGFVVGVGGWFCHDAATKGHCFTYMQRSKHIASFPYICRIRKETKFVFTVSGIDRPNSTTLPKYLFGIPSVLSPRICT